MLLTISGYDPQKLSKTCASYLYIRVELSQLFGTLTPSLCDFYDLSALKRSDWWRDANSVSWWAAVKGLTLMCWLDCDNEPITGMIWIWGDDFIFNFSVVIVGPFFWHHHNNLRCRWEFNGCTLTRTNQFSRKTTPPFWCVRIIRRIQFLWLTAEHQWEVLMLYSCGLQF